jgi:hypothetical protein
MVIRGNTRGNGSQLGHYLLTLKDNDHIQILDVAGRRYAEDGYLHDVIFGMQLNSELTKSVKGLYHAQINPSENESKTMTAEDWFKAADILEKELGFDNQTRIIVLHEKKGRTHAHVVWDRYDVDKGIMKTVSFSRLAQDRARLKMEEVFNHQQTPRRNKHRPEMKEALTGLWAKTKNGDEFIAQSRKAGYIVAEGSMRNPFMVVDEHGRSFDLVRQLKGIRIKEVRERMRNIPLIHEKQAIEEARSKQGGNAGKSEQQQASHTPKANTTQKVKEFAQSRNDAVQDTETDKKKREKDRIAREFGQSSKEATEDNQSQDKQRKQTLANEFSQSRNEAIENTHEGSKERISDNQKLKQEFSENMEVSEKERLKQQFLEEQQEITERKKKRGYRF